jgi:hypothetical protein
MTQRRSSKAHRSKSEGSKSEASQETDPPADQHATGERPLSARVALGPISIDLPGEWRFYPLDDRLACRPMSGVGVLQITPAAHRSPAASATHEMLMAAAKRASGYELEGPGVDKARESIDSGRAGGESFHAGRDYVRVWYHQRPEGLVLAWFACPSRRIAERSVARLIGQCDRIIASVRLPPTMDA